jgi:tetratricopeptide (TPR) repeat protein
MDSTLKFYSKILLISLLFLCASSARAQDPSTNLSEQALSDSEKVDELLLESAELFAKEQPIDARAKLQEALRLSPKDYRVHLQLGAYYLTEVAHFRLAHKYLTQAEELFEEQHPNKENYPEYSIEWSTKGEILFWLAEAKLNLDKYEDALATLEEFGENYWKDSLPGSQAWILMKLKRLDDAILIAQAGLMRGAESGRTYNILGILLSMKENRILSLEAFSRAIQFEMQLGKFAQAATPLSNAGEVYNEIFKDDYAEAAWIEALSLNDGCEHILPSSNIAGLYINQLRLKSAEQKLNEFEICFAKNAERIDTEHRVLLSLFRARILMLQGDIDSAMAQLTLANDRQQWFGKIGTNENDMKLAVSSTRAIALNWQANSKKDHVSSNVSDYLKNKLEIISLKAQSAWQMRKARLFAIEDVSDFEDLYVKHSDSMLDYGTLGEFTAGISSGSFENRINQLKSTDKRKPAQGYYDLYLAQNFENHGLDKHALEQLKKSRAALRNFDRLARAEGLAVEIKINDSKELREKLFELLPSSIRYHDFSLPVSTKITEGNDFAKTISKKLSSQRFEYVTSSSKPKYELRIIADNSDSESATVSLWNLETESLIASRDLKNDEKLLFPELNNFIRDCFLFRYDNPGQQLPSIELSEGLPK